MQWVLVVVGGVIALVLGLVIVGLLLPRKHIATSTIELSKPPSEVWAVIRDLGQVPAFWPDIKSSVRQPDRDGREVWLQTMKNGFALPLEIEEERPPSRLVTRIAIEGKAPFGGIWIYEITESGTGTRVSVTEDGFVDNPFFRVVSRVMGHHATLDSYLRALGKRMGGTAEPRHEP
jgi:uncharacterized protein YndB with AHSA1/START domain